MSESAFDVFDSLGRYVGKIIPASSSGCGPWGCLAFCIIAPLLLSIWALVGIIYLVIRGIVAACRGRWRRALLDWAFSLSFAALLVFSPLIEQWMAPMVENGHTAYITVFFLVVLGSGAAVVIRTGR
jgi:hypothetical protein